MLAKIYTPQLEEILKGINLEVKAGEIHAIMGPTVPEKKYACVNHRRK
jgi:Fe-S cluster assembly ATPase SufC